MSHKGLFASLSPKASFFAGIGAMLIVFFVVGFFVLLTLQLKKDAEASPVATNQGQNTPPASPTEVNIPPVTEDDWVYGNTDARITIVEYSDFECPYCATVHPTLEKLTIDYPDDVRWVYRHFPLSSIHPSAERRAEAAECAGNLGGTDAFWEYASALFSRQDQFTNEGIDAQLTDLAVEIGIRQSSFASCLSENTYADVVAQQYADAVAAGGQGTPYSIILFDEETIPVSGAIPYEQFKSFVDSVLTDAAE